VGQSQQIGAREGHRPLEGVGGPAVPVEVLVRLAGQHPQAGEALGPGMDVDEVVDPIESLLPSCPRAASIAARRRVETATVRPPVATATVRRPEATPGAGSVDTSPSARSRVARSEPAPSSPETAIPRGVLDPVHPLACREAHSRHQEDRDDETVPGE